MTASLHILLTIDTSVSLLPYRSGTDDVVGLVLLSCFILSAYVLARNRGLLVQLGKEFMLQRERTSIFANSTATDMRHLSLLFLQTCLLAGICLFCYFVEEQPELTVAGSSLLSPPLLLAVYMLLALLFFLLRWVFYSILGWIFFNENKSIQWMSAYSTILYYLGAPLFFLAMAMTYLPLRSMTMAISGTLVIVLIEIMVFYKWFKLFCNDVRGLLPLILYFCALEAMPYLLLYRFLLQLNEFFIIKI